MKSKRIKQIFIGLVSMTFILALILFIHLYQVTHQHPEGQLQLSRIDFKQHITNNEASQIRGYVSSLPGVKTTLFNTENGVLVYTYYNRQQSSEAVYKALMKHGNYKAVRYVVSAEQANSGCPAMTNNSFSAKLVSYIASL